MIKDAVLSYNITIQSELADETRNNQQPLNLDQVKNDL